MNTRYFIRALLGFLYLSFLAMPLYAGNLEEDILRYTNDYRRSMGKPPLAMNNAACRLAARHSRDMASGKTPFGHGGFSDRARSIKEKLGRVSAVAENVAYGDMTARQVVDGWIKSKPHRKNMLGNYTLIGIGTSRKRDGTIYFTQFFVKP